MWISELPTHGEFAAPQEKRDMLYDQGKTAIGIRFGRLVDALGGLGFHGLINTSR
jgi:hypothetical protein